MKIVSRFLRTSALSAGLVLLFCAPALRASLIWDWSYSSSLYTGSGTLTTQSTPTPGPFVGFLVVSIAGTWDDDDITGLLPLGVVSNDNLVSLLTPQLDALGLGFSTVADGNVNIYHNGLTDYNATSEGFGADTPGIGSFSATLVTPEPATTVSIGTALLGLALFLRHRNSRRTTPTP